MRFVIALLFALAAVPAQAEIFKCKNKDGSTSFSDHACPSDATALSVPKSAQKDAPVNWLCDIEGHKEGVGDEDAMSDRQRSALSSAMSAVASAGEVKTFNERGNVHICVRPAGARPGTPVVSETVVTTEGQTWIHANGKSRRVGDGEEALGGAACTSRVAACIGPDEKKVEACVNAVPVCGAATAGACCPNDCLASFKTARVQGVPVPDAVQRMVTLPICAGSQ